MNSSGENLNSMIFNAAGILYVSSRVYKANKEHKNA
jgi:hypothetical protein